MSRAGSWASIAAGVMAAAASSAAFGQDGQAAHAGPPVAVHEQDVMADYLERMGLQSLLLEHLSTSMKGADSESRLKIAERLARHYASLLADAPDAARRSEIVAHAESLLKLVPQAKAYELRVGLLRTRYSAAEEQAELVRMRLAGPAVKEESLRALADVRAQMLTLASELGKKEDALSRALDGGPADADRLERDLADVRRWRSTAQYFAGWAAVYGATLSPNAGLAVEAEREFSAILAAGDAPTPTKVDKSLLKYEHVARSVVGLAALRSLEGKDADAIAWLDLIRDTATADPATRASLMRWRVVVLSAAGRWADLDRDVRRWRAGAGQAAGAEPRPKDAAATAEPAGTLDPPTARLLAVVALEANSKATADISRGLARLAVGDLIAHRQLASVLDLARKYGADALTDGQGGGFIARYVRGMQRYESAVEKARAQGSTLEEPANSPELINAFNESATDLLQALGEPDASAFGVEQGVAAATSARALFMAGKLREAAERFSQAFERSRDAGDAATAQENLYLAIVTLERALKRGPGKADELAINERLEQLSTLFIKTYPSSERAVTLTLRSIARTDRTDEEAVRVLQSVGQDSAAYEAARRQLGRLLYRLYRSAPPDGRAFASARFLRAADEVLAMDRKEALEAKGGAQPAAVERLVATGRQMLDAALSTTPPDVAKAEQTMAVVAQALVATGTPAERWADELDFRSLQIALARGQLDRADTLADTIRARMDGAKPGSEALNTARRFHSAARRSLMVNADAALRSAVDDAARAQAARRVLNNGLPLTDEIVPSPASMKDPASAAIVSRVAEAGAVLWRLNKDAAARDAALRLDRALVAARGASAESAVRLAELTEGAGDVKAAMESWRTVASIVAEESPDWFRAKYELFRLLADSDAKAAGAAVSQHLILHPEGPEPWQGRIKALSVRLGVPATPAAAPAGGGAK